MSERIRSGPIIHHPSHPLTVVGGDPGATAGLVAVRFTQRKRDGTPLWSGAQLLGAATVSKPDRQGATHAELDILYRRKIIETLRSMLPTHNATADIVALEEPMDGGAQYRAKPAPGQKAASPEDRTTGFRTGAAYGAMLAACATQTVANRFISFPVKPIKGRRGWMPGRRADVLRAGEALLLQIAGTERVRTLRTARGKRAGEIPEHLLMAVGVINHLVEYYLDYLPPEP